MSNKIEGLGYACSICNRIHPNLAQADACMKEHEVVYIAMTRTEFNRLVNAIFLQDFSIIPDTLLEKLQKDMRNLARS